MSKVSTSSGGKAPAPVPPPRTKSKDKDIKDKEKDSVGDNNRSAKGKGGDANNGGEVTSPRKGKEQKGDDKKKEVGAEAVAKNDEHGDGAVLSSDAITDGDDWIKKKRFTKVLHGAGSQGDTKLKKEKSKEGEIKKSISGSGSGISGNGRKESREKVRDVKDSSVPKGGAIGGSAGSGDSSGNVRKDYNGSNSIAATTTSSKQAQQQAVDRRKDLKRSMSVDTTATNSSTQPSTSPPSSSSSERERPTPPTSPKPMRTQAATFSVVPSSTGPRPGSGRASPSAALSTSPPTSGNAPIPKRPWPYQHNAAPSNSTPNLFSHTSHSNPASSTGSASATNSSSSTQLLSSSPGASSMAVAKRGMKQQDASSSNGEATAASGDQTTGGSDATGSKASGGETTLSTSPPNVSALTALIAKKQEQGSGGSGSGTGSLIGSVEAQSLEDEKLSSKASKAAAKKKKKAEDKREKAALKKEKQNAKKAVKRKDKGKDKDKDKEKDKEKDKDKKKKSLMQMARLKKNRRSRSFSDLSQLLANKKGQKVSKLSTSSSKRDLYIKSNKPSKQGSGKTKLVKSASSEPTAAAATAAPEKSTVVAEDTPAKSTNVPNKSGGRHPPQLRKSESYDELKRALSFKQIKALTETLDEVDASEQCTIEVKSGQVFGIELEKVMELQSVLPKDASSDGGSSSSSSGSSIAQATSRVELSSYDARVPFVLVALARGVIAAGGTQQQGLFRVPGKKATMDVLREQLNSGNYEFLPGTDAHDIASLMKEWLRSLPSPLIPVTFYSRCIESVGRPADCLKVIDELPDLNKSVVKYVISYLQQHILLPEVQRITRMDISSVAMAFAPCFLDNPNQKMEEMVKNMQSQIKYLVNLLMLMNIGVEIPKVIPKFTQLGRTPNKRDSCFIRWQEQQLAAKGASSGASGSKTDKSDKKGKAAADTAKGKEGEDKGKKGK